MRFLRCVLCLTGCVLLAASAFAQTNPTGVISGSITDPDGLAIPGVTITATSPALQGARTAVTSANGDYILPFLPAGEYTVTFELSGFATLEQTVRVQVAETVPLNAQLTVAGGDRDGDRDRRGARRLHLSPRRRPPATSPT